MIGPLIRLRTIPRALKKMLSSTTMTVTAGAAKSSGEKGGLTRLILELQPKSTLSAHSTLSWLSRQDEDRGLDRRSLGLEGDKYHQQGGDLETIGLKPQDGRGIEEMKTTVELLKEHRETRGFPAEGRVDVYQSGSLQ
jgi:hypothetical protein